MKNGPALLKPPNCPSSSAVAQAFETITRTVPNPSKLRAILPTGQNQFRHSIRWKGSDDFGLWHFKSRAGLQGHLSGIGFNRRLNTTTAFLGSVHCP